MTWRRNILLFSHMRTYEMHKCRARDVSLVRPRNRRDRDGSSYASSVSVRRHIIMAIKGRIANCADLNILVNAMHQVDEARHEERRRVRA